jgi:hypothetical protein
MAVQEWISTTAGDTFIICGKIPPATAPVLTIPGNKFYVYNNTFIFKIFSGSLV